MLFKYDDEVVALIAIGKLFLIRILKEISVLLYNINLIRIVQQKQTKKFALIISTIEPSCKRMPRYLMFCHIPTNSKQTHFSLLQIRFSRNSKPISISRSGSANRCSLRTLHIRISIEINSSMEFIFELLRNDKDKHRHEFARTATV